MAKHFFFFGYVCIFSIFISLFVQYFMLSLFCHVIVCGWSTCTPFFTSELLCRCLGLASIWRSRPRRKATLTRAQSSSPSVRYTVMFCHIRTVGARLRQMCLGEVMCKTRWLKLSFQYTHPPPPHLKKKRFCSFYGKFLSEKGERLTVWLNWITQG